MQNETNFKVYVNGVVYSFPATNQFHALNRARKLFPYSYVSLKSPHVATARVESSYRNNGRRFRAMVFANGTTADID